MISEKRDKIRKNSGKGTKKILLAALDLDGTLLHEDKSISDYTLKILQKAVEHGIILVPASGRALNGMRENILKIKGIRYAICSNGASTVNIETGETIQETFISTERAVEMIEYLKQYPVSIYAHTDQGIFRERTIEKRILCEKFPYICFGGTYVENLAHYFTENKIKIFKLGILVLENWAEKEILEKGSPNSHILFFRTGDRIVEVNSSASSKGNALRFLCEKLEIPMEKVLAIGDNENDISMLELAGVAAAMGNAKEDVKSVACWVAATNEEDGAARFLEEWI